MNGDSKYGMKCAEFDALLADALDDLLSETDEARFQAHLAACSNCASVFGEAKAGLQWLLELKGDEVDPPPAMFENILKATIGTSPIPQAAKPTKGWWERLKESPALAPIFQTVLQPRFAMGFGMAFFSITMLLNLAGVKVKNIRYIDLRPAAIKEAYGKTTGNIQRYWANIRFVYEVESKVRDLKRATTPAQKTNENKTQHDQKKENKETSGVPGEPTQAQEAFMGHPRSQDHLENDLEDRNQGRSEGGQLASAAITTPQNKKDVSRTLHNERNVVWATQTGLWGTGSETGSSTLDYGQRRLS
jgi:hypothetical protein